MKKSKLERLATLVVLRSALFNAVVFMPARNPMFEVYTDAFRRVNLKLRRIER